MLSRAFLLLFTFLSGVIIAQRANCQIELKGFIKDAHTNQALGDVHISISPALHGTLSHTEGLFSFTDLCPGPILLKVSHLGYASLALAINLQKDTLVYISLSTKLELLPEALITQTADPKSPEKQRITADEISLNSSKGLSGLLDQLPGVNSLKTGSGLAKPMVQGLYGNRLAIINNGVSQSGQQWGIDHAPEIDPMVAKEIIVLKGVASLEYQGSSLGSVLVIKPRDLNIEPRLGGQIAHSYQSNGGGHKINLNLEQGTPFVSWRILGSLKKVGDRKSPSYYLNNTGVEEANYAFQAEKKWNSRWVSDIYLSSFNSRIGILRGSQIGNLSDLNAAFAREIPFFTQENFSYDIDAPQQMVHHMLLKLKSSYRIKDKQILTLSYAWQNNSRQEFDIRRSGRSDLPALSLAQKSHFVEGKYQGQFDNGWIIKSGLQWNRVDNQNVPETGILPLIPDYISQEIGLFILGTKTWNKISWDLGGRYDVEGRNVAAISQTIPREILRFTETYQNTSLLNALHFALNKNWTLNYSLGLTARNPEVNELYSNGLHQGISGIEEGNSSLSKETSLKQSLSIAAKLGRKMSFEVLAYSQNISNYIFLIPRNEIRLTIRGAFPVFGYTQTNAQINGLDFKSNFDWTKKIKLQVNYSYLFGRDLTHKEPLVFMPPNRLYSALKYKVKPRKHLSIIEFEINHLHVFEQNNWLPSQDYISPPRAYHLLGAKVSGALKVGNHKMNLFLSVENALNSPYRDYLNRQRYFADEMGINLIVGISFSF